MPNRSDLHTYQLEAYSFALANLFSALWMDMGLGKTITILTLILDLLIRGDVEHVLIVAPLRVALQTWPNEIRAWDHTRHLEYQVIRPEGDEPEIEAAANACRDACDILRVRGPMRSGLIKRAQTRAANRVRAALAKVKAPISIINQDALDWLVRLHGNNWPYDCVIFDESSGLRSRKSKRFIAMAHIRPKLKRLHLLTGTPAPETYMDLFTQTYLLDLGKRFGVHVTPFREEHFIYNQFSREYKLRTGHKNVIIDKLHGIVLPMQAEDHLPMNKPLFINRPVVMTEDEQKIYTKLEQTAFLDLPDGTQLEAENASSMTQRLLQLAGGAVYGENKAVHVFHNHKIAELEQIVAEAQGKPILVAYWFQSSRKRLLQAFPKAQAMDKDGKLEALWNKGKLPMMLVHPRGSGHGLNLQHGGHILVWFDLCYPLELYMQMNKRLDRQGQKNVVKIFHITTKKTIDRYILPKLEGKADSQQKLFERLKWLRSQAKRAA
jgi:SNF2 family DNA or RNA helicase